MNVLVEQQLQPEEVEVFLSRARMKNPILEQTYIRLLAQWTGGVQIINTNKEQTTTFSTIIKSDDENSIMSQVNYLEPQQLNQVLSRVGYPEYIVTPLTTASRYFLLCVMDESQTPPQPRSVLISPEQHVFPVIVTLPLEAYRGTVVEGHLTPEELLPHSIPIETSKNSFSNWNNPLLFLQARQQTFTVCDALAICGQQLILNDFFTRLMAFQQLIEKNPLESLVNRNNLQENLSDHLLRSSMTLVAENSTSCVGNQPQSGSFSSLNSIWNNTDLLCSPSALVRLKWAIKPFFFLDTVPRLTKMCKKLQNPCRKFNNGILLIPTQETWKPGVRSGLLKIEEEIALDFAVDFSSLSSQTNSGTATNSNFIDSARSSVLDSACNSSSSTVFGRLLVYNAVQTKTSTQQMKSEPSEHSPAPLPSFRMSDDNISLKAVPEGWTSVGTCEFSPADFHRLGTTIRNYRETLHLKIIECKWNTRFQQWIPVRQRYPRTKPNSLETWKSVQLVIAQGLTPNDFAQYFV